MKKAARHFTAADVLKHQERHGGVKCTCSAVWKRTHKGHSQTCPLSLFTADTLPTEEIERVGKALKKFALPQPVKMSRPEREMGMILEAQKRRREIVDYRFQGMSLAYSPDPETGIQLRYKCDYVVIEWSHSAIALKEPNSSVDIKIIECKGHGKHAISADAKLRFKGAKAAWPMFQFEMWQRERDGNWRRVL